MELFPLNREWLAFCTYRTWSCSHLTESDWRSALTEHGAVPTSQVTVTYQTGEGGVTGVLHLNTWSCSHVAGGGGSDYCSAPQHMELFPCRR
ncbi:hypothetical protein J6590_060037 [Homalodisca vitripennis]|nr:hypothetical protein J6590_060037 [Homalodisca vitripennis]